MIETGSEEAFFGFEICNLGLLGFKNSLEELFLGFTKRVPTSL